jgi:membrane-associated protease RseP (regulator of RpoE activity)
VRVTASGYATTQRLVSLQQGDEQRLEIRLSQAGALRGVASFEGGAPAPSAAVVLAGPGGERLTLTTNKDGSFSAANLAPGTWIITATARGLSGRVEATVEAEETSRVSLLVGEEATPVEEVVEARGARFIRKKGAWTVASVEAGSAAQEADLFPGDVLRNINGAPPGDAASLQAKLAASGPLELVVFGEDGEVKVTIE